MAWFYKSNEQEFGPVSDAELEQLFRAGQISHDTAVRREDLTAWVPFATARAAVPPPLPPNAGGRVCAECGKRFPADELVSLNKSWVCAQCKPVFLQRMAEGVSTPGGPGLWRQGKKIITRSETPFPDRCIKCNAPANGFRLKRVLYWQHPAYYLLLLCNLLVLLIVVLIVRKKAILHIGLCEAHRKQRLMAIIICIVGLLGGLGVIIAGGVMGSGWLALAGVVFFLTGAVWGVVWGRTITPTKIDKEFVWVTGAGKAFLDELPERPG